MSEGSSAEGRCLCGAVTLKATRTAAEYGACHCQMCRRWTGGPFLAVECGADVTIDGEEAVEVFVSSEWGERGFCKRCGTHLFWRLRATGEHHVALGLFGDTIDPAFTLQLFVDRKPASYAFSNETRELTEQQVFEMFAPEG